MLTLAIILAGGVAEPSSAQEGRLVTTVAFGLAAQSKTERLGGRVGVLGRVAGGTQLLPRVAVNVSASAAVFADRFDVAGQDVYAPCHPEIGCPPPGPGEPSSMGSIAVELTLREFARPNRGLFLVVGPAWHRTLERSDRFDAIVPGVVVGGGVLLTRGGRQLALDVRHHRVGRWEGRAWSMTPLTLSMTW